MHEQLFDTPYRNAGVCCFNHIIGLPIKDGETKPIFDYEIELFKYLQNYKHLWIKKARGLGITEFLLRFMGYLALSSDEFQNKRFVIVTGPKQRIAEDIIRRMRFLYQDFIYEESRLDRIILNDVTIEAFPSHTIAMRGYTDFKFILLDEADFFQPSEQEEVISVARGYIVKTQPWIVMVSTPNEPNSLFHRIENEKSDEAAGFKRLFYLYERGLGKIYNEAFIEEEKSKPYFRREYLGEYGFGIGNLFSETMIQSCEKLGRTLDIDSNVNTMTRKSMGIDAGWGSSRMAFTVSEYYEGKIRVIYTKAFERPDFNTMVDLAYNLTRTYKPQKTFIDGSFPSYIRALKKTLGEEEEYMRLVELAKSRGDDLTGYMDIIPVNFAQRGQPMLDHLKEIVDKGMLAINPDRSQGHVELLSDLRIAKNKPDSLKLEKTINTMDLFDSLRLALEYYQ